MLFNAPTNPQRGERMTTGKMLPQNDLLLRAARGEETERVPVWLMRQAGRIIPEYRKIREEVGSFLKLIETPELAAEITLQPVEILGVDAAIIFSDILVVPKAMGLNYEMVEEKGPVFKNRIRSEKDIDNLQPLAADSIAYVCEAIKIVKKKSPVPLIGFAGSPWTVMAFMVEGGSSKSFAVAKQYLVSQPVASHTLLERIAKSTVTYLKAQINTGADIIQIFDTLAGVLSPDAFEKFSLPYIKAICTEIKSSSPHIPMIVFSKGANYSLEKISELPCDVLGLDWNISGQEVRRITGDKKILQGNLNPSILLKSQEEIKKQTLEMVKGFGPNRYIANLGHGVLPETPLENVKLFVDTIKNLQSVS